MPSTMPEQTLQLRATGMLIGGQWLQTAASSFDVRNPATGEVLCTLPAAGPDDVAAAVRAARTALDGEWGALPAAQRGRVLNRIADRLEQEQERISQLESTDNGRPRRETVAQASIVARWFRYYAGMADKIEGATIPVRGPYLNFTERVPVGVCGAITPWNHPLLIAAKKIAPALACGNTLVVKPSELAPLSVLEFGRLAGESGLPPGVLNLIPGGPETGAALVAHPDVDRIDVTGSTRTGVRVAEAAAKTLKRVGLELGGKAANLVFADADLDRAAAGVVFSGFVAQGQSCVAGARVLVEASVSDDFINRMRARASRIRVGDPQDLNTQMGPLIEPAAARRVGNCVDAAQDDGVTLVCGGRVPDVPVGLAPDGFYAPTILLAEDPTVAAAQDEIFGPVVTVIPVRTEAEAIAVANGTPYGLGAGIWTEDVTRAHRVASGLRAGITWINDYHRIDPASPWGGFGRSGYGRENGYEAVYEYTEVKSVWVPRERSPMDWYDQEGTDARLN